MFHKEQNYVKIILCKNEKTQLNVEHQRAAMHLKFFSLISLEADLSYQQLYDSAFV